jgi:hypothetical protein
MPAIGPYEILALMILSSTLQVVGRVAFHRPAPRLAGVAVAADAATARPARSRLTKRVWIAAPGCLAALGLVATVAGLVGIVEAVRRETTEAVAVVDEYLTAGAGRDSAAGSRLFASEVGRGAMSAERLDRYFAARADLFEGYQAARWDGFDITEVPGSATMTLRGAVVYRDRSRRFEAALIKIDRRWRLLSMRILDEIGQLRSYSDAGNRGDAYTGS